MSRRSVTRPEVRVGGFWLSSITPQGWGSLRHSTRTVGSWEASWQIPFTGNWRHPALVYGARVEVHLGPIVMWSGSLDEPDWDSGQMIALGACRDAETALALTGAGVASTAPNTVIDAAIARGVLSWTRVGDFGTTPVGQADDGGGLVTVQSVLDAWAQENNSGWRVDEHRNLVIAPLDETTVEWFVTPGSGVLGSAAEERVDRVFARYISTTAGKLATASFPATTPVGGIEKPVDLTDRGPMSATKAADVAESIWSDMQGRSGWTNGLTLKRGQVTTPGGVVADPSAVKGGDTMRLLGVPDARGTAHNLDVVLGDTDYDWSEDSLQANPVGLAARDTESVLEQVGNLAVDAMARASSSSGLAVLENRAHAERNKTGAQSIGNGSFVTVSWAHIAIFGITYSAGTFTVDQAGRYDVRATISFAANATGVRRGRIMANGSEVVRDSSAPLAGTATQMLVSTVVTLAAGDTLEIQAFQDSGGSLNLDTSCRLTIEQVA